MNRAKAAVASRQVGVAQLQSALDAATARLESATTAAESAAENYNGALWRLSEARKAVALTRLQVQAAKASVVRQRAGIVTLVTDSYQNGTDLNTATAMLSDEGPAGLMNRYGVVASAGDSMQARYDAFRLASAHAKEVAVRAGKAKERQSVLATEAKSLAVVAGRAASAAGAAANQIAGQKQQLMVALASAQHISVDLATRRHAGLERIAAQKAAAAARAREAAKRVALEKQARKARKTAADAKPPPGGPTGYVSAAQDTSFLPAFVPAPQPVANPAPNQAVAVKRSIAYAKAQLGKPYQWAAAGPGTFDCSGLTMQAWAAGGTLLPHYSVAQFYQSTPVSMADARPGDLLFWSSNGSPSGIHHVALYLGGGQFLEAPHTGAFVRFNSIDTWYPDFVARP